MLLEHLLQLTKRSKLPIRLSGRCVLKHTFQLTARQCRWSSSMSHHNSLAHPAQPCRNLILQGSRVHIGTSYEYLCRATLSKLCFNLTRQGGRADKGVDLIGTWDLPSQTSSDLHRTLRVVVQCKAHKAAPTPSWIRELEGAVSGAATAWRHNNTIGLLCAKGAATPGVREAIRSTQRPVVWVRIQEVGKGEEAHAERLLRSGKIEQIYWNNAVQCLVGQEIGYGLKFVPVKGQIEKEVRLTWQGKVWYPDTLRQG